MVQLLPENGLPSTTVYGCVQDQYGFIWFATSAGLSRFDGTFFRTYTVRDGLPDNEVLGIHKDSLNRMWIWCFNQSVCYYDPVRQKIITEKEDTAIKAKSIKNFSGNPRLLKGMRYAVNSLKWINNKIYLPNDRGVFVYDKDTVLVDSLLLGINVYSVYNDRDGNLWFNTSGSGVFCELKNEALLYDKTDGLSSENIQCVYVNNEGNVYVGNNVGVIDIIRKRRYSKSSMLHELINIKYNMVRKIAPVGKYGTMAITDHGVYIAGNKEDDFKLMPQLAMYNKTFSLSPSGNVLVGSSNTMGLYDLENKQVSVFFRKRITALLAEDDGRFWFGSIDGLHYYNATAEEKDMYLGNRYASLSKTVSHINSSVDSLVWVATNSYGIVILYKGKIIGNVNESKGLVSDICRKVFIDNKGKNAWVATNKGLDKLHYRFENGIFSIVGINHYTTALGIADNEVNDVCIYNDTIYVATTKGLSIIQDTRSDNKIELFFTKVRVGNEEYKLQKTYHFGYRQNSISVSYVGICYSCGGRINYQYRLLAGSRRDTGWNSVTGNTLEFAGLSPANYILQVTTADSLPISMEFSISKPLWQTWPFLFVSAFLLSGLVYTVYRIRINRIKKEEKQKTVFNSRIAGLELKLLQAQLNPHFIFNSLNAIQFYINKMDRKLANDYLVKLSRLMRLFLDSSKDMFSTIARETEIARLYCELEKLRFDNRFEFEIKISENIQPDNTYFPSMLIQPFVENAINHGLVSKKGDGLLCISFDKDGGTVRCIIDDNGIGRKASDAMKKSGGKTEKSWGLNLSLERMDILNMMGDMNSGIEIIDKISENGEAAGTLVIITTTVVTNQN